MRKAPLAVVLLAVAVTLAGCEDEGFFRRTASYTFESTLAPWEPDGTDLDDPPVQWSIERSNIQANEGEWSVKLELENLNDAGKIWMEAIPLSFRGLTPGATYDVRIAFDFGSSDSEINAWQIIAGTSPVNPETAGHLTFRESTAVPGGEFTWLRKEYAFRASAGPEGTMWVSIGVWGTSEFPRTYFIDAVDVELSRST